MKEVEAERCSAMARRVTCCYFFEPRSFSKQPKVYKVIKAFSITNNTVFIEGID